MPNRILKESITTSEDINRLSTEAEILFYRLMVKADDFGAFFGNEQIIKGECFPLRTDTIKTSQVLKWLDELERARLIFRYTAEDGRKYLRFVKWDKHQQRRASKSKFPLVEVSDITCNQLISNDINGNQLQSIVSDSASAPNTYTNTDTNTNSITNKTKDDFYTFSDGDEELLEALRGFEEMRKNIKKPLTDRARKLILQKLQTFPRSQWIEILNQSVFNNWQGIYELKTDHKKKTNNVFLEMLEEEYE